MKVLITGISGQDGAILAGQLVEKGHEVHGMVRRHSTPAFPNLATLIEKDAIMLHEGDLTDQHSLDAIVANVRPDEVYNLGAQTYVGVSYTEPEHTIDVTGLGALRMFEAVRRQARNARVYQASSSEVFGDVLAEQSLTATLSEVSAMRPASPYGVAKLAAHNLAGIYRSAYGMHISCGILFNHEAPGMRGPQFVTRKITLGLARIKHGKQAILKLGNLSAVRDWGYAAEYTEGMSRILAHDVPGDWVLATGEGNSVREFLVAAHQAAGFSGDVDQLVAVRQEEKRPTDIARLVGNAAKAEVELGWVAKVQFRELVGRMMRHDLDAVGKEVGIRG